VSAPRVAGLPELLAEHGDATYREVLRVPALSLGLFAVAPGHDDVQSPHEVDEVYVVVAGRAVLEVDGVRTPVTSGSVAYVPPHVPHRFLDVTEDLRVVVVFAPPGPR
jgi:mannose-6-phosphate isomerase-like protein (cupin superfamily)